jgi:NAD(P)-dependent dehydrogenase (short-subunit alcohol dehydrogenase family)
MPPPVHWPAYAASMASMAGKTIAITGCTSGTGLVLAQQCAALGAKVVMLNRPSERADRALQLLKARGADATLVPCDLLSLASVRAAAASLRSLLGSSGLDVLCCNAGIMGMPDEATIDGFDTQMQANHLSHFLLVSEAWPLLETAASKRGEARVVNHSSGARKRPAKPLAPGYLAKNGGALGGDGFPGLAKWQRYQQSKLANLLFTYALHEHIATERPALADRVKVLCAHPGPTDSGLQAKTTKAGGTGLLDRFILWSTLMRAHAVEDGALGIARACCEPGVQSGQFYGPTSSNGGPAVLLPAERDASAEEFLWSASLEAVGKLAFFDDAAAGTLTRKGVCC